MGNSVSWDSRSSLPCWAIVGEMRFQKLWWVGLFCSVRLGLSQWEAGLTCDWVTAKQSHPHVGVESWIFLSKHIRCQAESDSDSHAVLLFSCSNSIVLSRFPPASLVSFKISMEERERTGAKYRVFCLLVQGILWLCICFDISRNVYMAFPLKLFNSQSSQVICSSM